MQEEEYSDSLVIVDDDPHVLSALRFAFEIEGYDVQTYTTGEEVLNAPPLSAACIVIDENLPGVSGVQTASLLRSHGWKYP
jgi:two-component system response regulator FixJ